MIYSNTETFCILSKDKKDVQYNIDILENHIFKVVDQNGLRLSLYDGEKNLTSGILKEFQTISFSLYMESDKYFIQFKIMDIEQQPIEINKNLNTIVVPIYLNIYLQRTDISYITKAVLTFSSKIEYLFSENSTQNTFTLYFTDSKIRSDNMFICLIQPRYMTCPFYIENNENILLSTSDNKLANIDGFILFDIIRCI